jgi:hypothetical protein
MHGITIAVLVVTGVFVTTIAATMAYVHGHQSGYQQRQDPETRRTEQ